MNDTYICHAITADKITTRLINSRASPQAAPPLPPPPDPPPQQGNVKLTSIQSTLTVSYVILYLHLMPTAPTEGGEDAQCGRRQPYLSPGNHQRLRSITCTARVPRQPKSVERVNFYRTFTTHDASNEGIVTL